MVDDQYGSPGDGGGAALDNYANNFSPPPGVSSRNRRYGRRAGVWQFGSIERCRKCGKVARIAGGVVEVRVTDGHAGFGGLVSCGSVWVCAVCASKVMQRRALEIGCAVAAAHSRGLGVVFETLTLRHFAHQRLVPLWDCVGHSWNRVTAGKGWTSDVAEFGIVGFVKTVETTVGRNGWHPHVHALIFGHELDASNVDELGERTWRRWASGAKSRGLDAPQPQASDWQFVGGDLSGTKLGKYLAGITIDKEATAGALGMELTQTQSKVARFRHSTITQWELLDSAIDGEVDALRLWGEFERGSKGRRQISWSKDLRALLGLDVVEKSDEDIAAEELGSRDDSVVCITPEGWSRLVARPWLLPEVLNKAESLGPEGLSGWLQSEGIDHWRVI